MIEKLTPKMEQRMSEIKDIWLNNNITSCECDYWTDAGGLDFSLRELHGQTGPRYQMEKSNDVVLAMIQNYKESINNDRGVICRWYSTPEVDRKKIYQFFRDLFFPQDIPCNALDRFQIHSKSLKFDKPYPIAAGDRRGNIHVEFAGYNGTIIVSLEDGDFKFKKVDSCIRLTEEIVTDLCLEVGVGVYEFVNEFVSNLGGSYEDDDVTINYSKDFIMTNKMESLINELKADIIHMVNMAEENTVILLGPGDRVKRFLGLENGSMPPNFVYEMHDWFDYELVGTDYKMNKQPRIIFDFESSATLYINDGDGELIIK